MKDRIKLVLSKTGLTGEKFGARIGVSQGLVSQMCTGRTTPSDRTITDICREFNVNEVWLRTGKGEMFLPKSRGQEIGEIVKAAAQHDPETAAKFFSSLLEEMSDAEIVLMYEIFKRHFGTAEKEKG